jgi:hypothetical protein
MSFQGGFGTDTDIDGKIPPIGSIVAVVITTAGCPTPGPRWEVCNGAAYPAASPMFGQNKPNLNATNRYLRGNTTSNSITVGSETHTHSNQAGGGQGTLTPGLTLSTENNLPPSMDVVWYVKVF